MNGNKKENKSGFKNSISFKLIVIVALSLILLIPSTMVKKLIDERSYRKEETVQTLTAKWGTNQTLVGPILQVPYENIIHYKNGEKNISRGEFLILPSNLEIKGDVDVDKKHKGIYDVLIYGGKLELKGTFKHSDFKDWPETFNRILWNDAKLILGISSLKGLTKATTVNWNNTEIKFSPGVSECRLSDNGINAAVVVNKEDTNTFSIHLSLNGSDRLYFTPVGNQSTFQISSNWGHPDFDGAFLPESSAINDTSFTALWRTSEMTRSYPQILTSESSSYHTNLQEFGVDFIFPVDSYQKSTRSVKYAFLFIAFTFLIMFFTEISSLKQIHPVQYLIVGLALIIFYSLLIALAEHMSFNLAYLTGSITIILMNTVYIHSLYKKLNTTITICIVLIILYAYLFTILQISDYALLLGNIGLVIALGVVMVYSGKVDWYGNKKSVKNHEENIHN
jgi:inner membrane protein